MSGDGLLRNDPGLDEMAASYETYGDGARCSLPCEVTRLEFYTGPYLPVGWPIQLMTSAELRARFPD